MTTALEVSGTPIAVPLSKLVLGHEAKNEANVRVVGRDEGIAELAASIDQVGLVLPPIVRKAPKEGEFVVIAGNRRVAALRTLRKKIGDDCAIPCILSNSTDAAGDLDISLSENSNRIALHPVDRFEAYRDLIEAGDTVEDIAAKYVMTVPQVRQSLSLAGLAQIVRDAWRKGEITAAVAEAFAGVDVKTQETVFRRLKKENSLHPHGVRRAVGLGRQAEVMAALKFVGRKEYEAGGHFVNETLFSRDDDEVSVSSVAALCEMVDVKIAVEVERLVKVGWAWAGTMAQAGYKDGSIYVVPRLPGVTNAMSTKEERAASGVIVGLDDSGKLEHTYGCLKPGEKPLASRTPAKAGGKAKGGAADKGAGAAAERKGPAALSNALDDRLYKTMAKATQEALAKGTYKDDLLGILARACAALIEPERPYATHIPDKTLDAIRDAITPTVMRTALLKHFDGEDYFKGAPLPFVVKAIKECGFTDIQFKTAKATKGSAWKFALANITKKGMEWLPPELRCSTYDGPGAKAPAVRAKKK